MKELFAKLITENATKYMGRIVIIIDALNQLDATYNAHSLDWLPAAFAPNVKIIVSTLRVKTCKRKFELN